MSETLNYRTVNRTFAWGATVILVAAAWLMGPNMAVVGTTAIYIAVAWAVLSRLRGGKWFIPICMLLACLSPIVYGDHLRSLHDLGWLFFTSLFMLLCCTLSTRLRHMLLAKDPMRTASAGSCVGRAPYRDPRTRRIGPASNHETDRQE